MSGQIRTGKKIKSLNRRFFWILLAGVFIFFGLLTALIIRRETSLIRELYRENSSSKANLISAQLEDLMSKHQTDDIQRYLTQLSRESREESVVILGPNGKAAFGTVADPSFSVPGGRQQEGAPKGFVFYKPLYNEPRCHKCHNPTDATRGAILIRHSMTSIDSEIRETGKRIVLFGFLLGLTSEIFLLVVMRKTVLNPLETLSRGAKMLEDGVLTHRIELNRKDELGALATCFNQMAESIEKSHSYLEEGVRQKTAELRIIAELSTTAFKGDLGFFSLSGQFLTAIRAGLGFEYTSLCLIDKEKGRLSPEFNQGLESDLCKEGISLGADHPFVECIKEAHPSIRKAEEVSVPGLFGNVIVVPILSHQRKRCREINDCRFENCPAYSNQDERCWLIESTLCRSPQSVPEPDKIYGCLHCAAFPVLGILIAGRTGEITRSSLHSIEILASELASAVEHQRFIESKHEDINKLIKLHDISVDVFKGFGKSVTFSVASSAATFSNTDGAILWLKHEDGKLYPEDFFNVKNSAIPASLHVRHLIGKAIRTEEIVETLETGKIPYLEELIQAGGFLYMAALPLKFKDTTVGCFTLFKKRDFPMTPSEKAIAALFASQTAATIQSAQIYRALRESEERYRGFVESATDMIFTISPEGVITALNPAFEAVTGWKPAEWISRHFAGLLHPEDLPLGIEMFHRALLGEKPPGFELRILHKTGEYLVAEITVSPYAHEGRTVGIFGIARDITFRKDADEEAHRLMRELKEQKEFSEAVFNNTSSGIMALSNEGRIIRINRAGSEILGASQEALIGKRSIDIHPALESAGVLDRNLDREIAIATAIGEDKPIGFSTSALLDSEGRQIGTVVVFRDLTEIKRLHKQLRSQEEYRTVAKVISGVAHEVRNPLFGISSIGQILERELGSPQHKTLVQAMLKETRRMRRLIDELLLYTRPARLDIKEIDLTALLEEMNHFARAKSEQIRVSLQVPSFLSVHGDRDKITQVLLNLINNAIEAARSTIVISAGEKAPGQVFVKVSDDGPGVSKDDMGRIFDPFFTTKKGGTGLGLPICKKVIEDHGGTLDLISAPGRGVDAIVTLQR